MGCLQTSAPHVPVFFFPSVIDLMFFDALCEKWTDLLLQLIQKSSAEAENMLEEKIAILIGADSNFLTLILCLKSAQTQLNNYALPFSRQRSNMMDGQPVRKTGGETDMAVVCPEGCLVCYDEMWWSQHTEMLSRWPVGNTLLLWFTRSVYQKNKTSPLHCLCGSACQAHRVDVFQLTDSSCSESGIYVSAFIWRG